MKIVVKAYQEYGKPIKKPKVYTFCCWQSLLDWLNGVSEVYRCDTCKQKEPKRIQQAPTPKAIDILRGEKQ